MTHYTALQQKISEKLPHIVAMFHEDLALHTSFRIGGPAEVIVFPKTPSELQQLLRFIADAGCQYRILGAGTNILAPDQGMDGITVCLKDAMCDIATIGDGVLKVSAGVTMSRAAIYAANQGLAGMEFAHGIPGTVGGGIYMNAGAYGRELKDICISVETMDVSGQIHCYSCEEMNFAYRSSILQRNNEIAISATFRLSQDDPEVIKQHMAELKARRSASQPLSLPSAGSAFKRPAGAYAAALIDQAGLKGLRVGDAAVSEKHAGFVVNLGQATAQDVCALLQLVAEKVYLHSGYQLEPEIRIW